jgi:hypothetical protein
MFLNPEQFNACADAAPNVEMPNCHLPAGSTEVARRAEFLEGLI